MESSRIRRDVREALGIETEPVPAVEPMRRRFRIGALAGAAAVLVAVVVAAPALNLLGTGSTGGEDAFDVGLPQTSARPQEALVAPESPPIATQELDTADGTAFDPSPPERVAASAPGSVAATEPLPSDFDLFAARDRLADAQGTEELGLAYLTPEDPSIPAAAESDTTEPSSAGTPETPSAPVCEPDTTKSADDGIRTLTLGPIDRNGVAGLVVAFFDPDGGVTVAILDAATCEIIEST